MGSAQLGHLRRVQRPLHYLIHHPPLVEPQLPRVGPSQRRPSPACLRILLNPEAPRAALIHSDRSCMRCLSAARQTRGHWAAVPSRPRSSSAFRAATMASHTLSAPRAPRPTSCRGPSSPAPPLIFSMIVSSGLSGNVNPYPSSSSEFGLAP